VGLLGLGCVTHPFKIRSNEIMSGKVGLYEVNSHLAAVEIRTEEDYKVFSCLIGQKSIQESPQARDPREDLISLKLEIPERI
jgi:hypothetical protein